MRKAGRVVRVVAQDDPGRSKSGKPPTTKTVAGSQGRWTVAGVCLLLAAITLGVFAGTFTHEFVNFDDGLYVYDNATVREGLTWHGIAQAFAHGSNSNWDPLTTLSHMVDCQLYGLHAGGHHLTNVLLHTLSVVLLFLVLRRMTGALWPSAFAAAVFAIHPLRVESVAWVTERKDVLSGLFFMLTLGAYVRYARRPARVGNYLLVMLFLALGLMSKAMLVTLPFLLLLLDYWPLKRFAPPAASDGDAVQAGWLGTLINHRRLVLEKLPLLGLSLLSCVIAVLAQGQAVESIGKLPFPLRIENAAVSVATYVWQLFFPVNLAVFYPYPIHGLPAWKILLSILLLTAISIGVFRARKKRPYLLVGWLWYLGMLMPVIGIVQLGMQAHADRYTYLPQIGLYFALAVWVTALWTGWQLRRRLLGVIAALVVACLGIGSIAQARNWRDSESLWSHAIAVTTDNALAECSYAMTLEQKGQLAGAIAHLQKAVAIQPDYAGARNNLGNALLQSGRAADAMAQYQRALEFAPDLAEAQNNLGHLLLDSGRLDEAIPHLRRAAELQPGDASAHLGLAIALVQKRLMDEAITEDEKALELQSDFPLAAQELGRIAWTLAASPDAAVRNGGKAVELARQAERLTQGTNAVAVATLAAAYAEMGKFPEAMATVQRATQLAQAQSNAPLAASLQAHLSLYQAGRPLRDESLKQAPPVH